MEEYKKEFSPNFKSYERFPYLFSRCRGRKFGDAVHDALCFVDELVLNAQLFDTGFSPLGHLYSRDTCSIQGTQNLFPGKRPHNLCIYTST